jgi:hypothetical protein
VLLLGLYRYKICMLIGVDGAAARAAVAELNAEFRQGTFAAADAPGVDGVLVWRDDTLVVKSAAAADASLRGTGSAPLCATFATAGDAQIWRVCNYGASSAPPATLASRVGGAVLVVGGAQLGSATRPSSFNNVGGLLWYPSSESVRRRRPARRPASL